MRQFVLLLGASGLLAACSAKNIDVGPITGGVVGNNGADAGVGMGIAADAGPDVGQRMLPQWPDSNACAATSDVPITGTWNGYQESSNGAWDTLRLVIRGASETGGVCGTLTIGTGAPPPPATDPNVGYPPGTETDAGPPFGVPPGLIEGFAFTLLGGSIQENRVRFGIGYFEPWRGWCHLQTPVPIAVPGGEGQYSCAHFFSGPWQSESPTSNQCVYTNLVSGERETISCAKLALCVTAQACVCNASQCEGNSGTSVENFDLHFDAAQADGSGHGGRIRFFRAD